MRCCEATTMRILKHLLSPPVLLITVQIGYTTAFLSVPRPLSNLRCCPSAPHCPASTTKKICLCAEPSDGSTAASTSTADGFDWVNQWYPLAPLQDLDPNAPNKLTLLGMDILSFGALVILASLRRLAPEGWSVLVGMPSEMYAPIVWYRSAKAVSIVLPREIPFCSAHIMGGSLTMKEHAFGFRRFLRHPPQLTAQEHALHHFQRQKCRVCCGYFRTLKQNQKTSGSLGPRSTS